ncbi:hypothetical protein D1872_262270 [compost metagenome]
MLLHHLPPISLVRYRVALAVHAQFEIAKGFLVFLFHEKRFADADIRDVVVGIQLQHFLPDVYRFRIFALVMQDDRFIHFGTEAGRFVHGQIRLAPIEHQRIRTRLFDGYGGLERADLISFSSVHIKQMAFVVVGEHPVLRRVEHAVHAVPQHFDIDELGRPDAVAVGDVTLDVEIAKAFEHVLAGRIQTFDRLV